MGKALGYIGGGTLALLLVFAAWTGLSNGKGRLTADSLGDGLKSGYDLATDRLSSIDTGPIAGNLTASALIALAVFAALVLLVPPVRGTTRGLGVALLVCMLLGIVLYVSPGG